MEKLVVLYDAGILENGLRNDATRSGVFFVSYNVVKRLLHDDRVDLYIYCKHDTEKLIVEYFQKEFKFDIKRNIFVEGDDLSIVNSFLSTMFAPSEYIKQFLQITCFTVVHDIIPLLFPYYFNVGVDNSWFDELVEKINRNDFYFAVSEHTKRDIIRYVPTIDIRKIDVIQLAADNRFYQNKDVLELQRVKRKYKIPLETEYIFSLCTLEERKNLVRAVTAFVSFIEKNNIEDIVFVLGGGVWDAFVGRLEKEVPNYHKYADKIIQVGYLVDEDLAVLFSNAEWFVYTSRYEGFGMPPLEAMQCGCPLIVSNNSSLPEVVGDAGIMIDYDSLEQHICAYELYYYDSELRERNLQKGLSRAQLFSWDRCVNTIVNKMTEIERSKHQKPLITVVTVTYNLIEKRREKFIQQCLSSVHQQTYSNIEHIVIDGVSTDGTIQFLEDYKNKGWIKLYSEPDRGIYDAMNKGIEKAHGTYVVFLNSDDFFHDTRGVELSVEYLMKCGADYSFADAQFIQEDGNKVLWKGDISKLLIGVHYCHQTMFVKTEVLKNMGGFDLSYRVSADSDLMVRLYAQKCEYTYVPFCFVSYRGGGFSGENSQQIRIDHSTAFFRHIGARIGLTPQDCFLLWQCHFFAEKDIKKQLNLIAKVPIEFGSEYLISQFVERLPIDKKDISCKLRFYLFGFVPLLNRKNRRNKIYYNLFNFILILKVVCYSNKRKYYLFGIIPIWKIKIW